MGSRDGKRGQEPIINLLSRAERLEERQKRVKNAEADKPSKPVKQLGPPMYGGPCCWTHTGALVLPSAMWGEGDADFLMLHLTGPTCFHRNGAYLPPSTNGLSRARSVGAGGAAADAEAAAAAAAAAEDAEVAEAAAAAAAAASAAGNT